MATVLIIDDSPMQIKLMRTMLEKMGHATLQAKDGNEGLEMAREQIPDLIMLDVVMPGMNGFDVTRQIRKDDKLKGIPVVLASSKSQDTDKQWGLRQGANGYLVKPYNKNELLSVIGEYLERAGSCSQAAV
jgi:twitching motility two-component system response regulator PilH